MHISNKRFISNNEERMAWFFIAPFFILYIVFTLYPAIGAFITSLHTGPFNRLKFTGLSNYIRLFSDKIFPQTLLNTFLFVFVSTIIYIPFALLFALWGQNKNRLSTIIRICIYIPTILTVSVMANVWDLIFRNQIGIWSYVMNALGLHSIAQWNWRLDPSLSRWTILLATLWWTVGSNMLIMIAGLRSVPKDIYEAAKIDGANEIVQFMKITLPHLYPMFKILVVLQALASFKLFAQPYLLTGGGPLHNTRSVALYIYDVGFGSRNPGYAAALSVILMIILVIFSVIQMRLLKKT